MGKKLKDLTEKTSLTGNEELYINDGGTDKKVKAKNMGGMTPEERKKLTELDLKVGEILRNLAHYDSNEKYAQLSVQESGMVIGNDGSMVNKSGYGISNDIPITKGSIYLFRSSVDISNHSLFTQKIVADIVYKDTYETITTESGETIERISSKATGKGVDLMAHTYTFVYNSGNLTAEYDDIKADGVSKGKAFVIPTQYVEYKPLFNANGIVARPSKEYYALVASVTGTMVVSGKLEDMQGQYIVESTFGVLKSIINQMSNMLITSSKQDLTEEQKAQGRENLGAASQGQMDYVAGEVTQKADELLLAIIAGRATDIIYENTDGNLVVLPGSIETATLQYKKDIKRIVAGNTSGSLYASFRYCTNLEVIEPLFVTKITSMASAFTGCTKLKRIVGIDRWDVSECTTVAESFNTQMFNGCESIEELDIRSWNLRKISNTNNFEELFRSCKKLKTLGLPPIVCKYSEGKMLDIPLSRAFIGDTALTNISCAANAMLNNGDGYFNVEGSIFSSIIFGFYGAAPDPSLITRESMLNVFNALGTFVRDTEVGDAQYNYLCVDVNGVRIPLAYTPTIKITPSVKQKLTTEDIAIATSKNWIIA